MTRKEIKEKFGDEMCILIVKKDVVKNVGPDEFVYWALIKTDDLSKYTDAIDKVYMKSL